MSSSSAELHFTLEHINPVNKDFYIESYMLLDSAGGRSYLDDRLNYLANYLDKIESDSIPIMVNTIYLETFRREFSNIGIRVSSDILLFEAIALYKALTDIRNSDDLIDYLASTTSDDCNLMILASDLDVPIISHIDHIEDSDSFIKTLYRDNKELIYGTQSLMVEDSVETTSI